MKNVFFYCGVGRVHIGYTTIAAWEKTEWKLRKAAELRAPGWTGFCLTTLSEEVEQAIFLELMCPDCYFHCRSNAFGATYWQDLRITPEQEILFGRALFFPDQPFFMVRGGCRNRISAERGQQKFSWKKMNSLSELEGNGERLFLMQF